MTDAEEEVIRAALLVAEEEMYVPGYELGPGFLDALKRLYVACSALLVERRA